MTRTGLPVVPVGLVLSTVATLAGCTDPLDSPRPELEMEALAPLEEVSAIRDLAITPAGSIWILNTAEPHLLLQNADGVLVVAFGRAGEGPEEFGFPAAIVEASDSAVTILDRERNLLQTLGTNGDEVAATPIEGIRTLVASDLDQVLAGSPFLAALEGRLVTSDFPEARRPGTAHLWNRRIVRVGPEDGHVEVIVDLREERDRSAERLGGASVLAPAPLWAHCPDGTIALYMPFQNQVRWIGLQAAVSTPESTRPLEDREADAALRGRLRRGPQSTLMSETDMDAAVSKALEQLGTEMSSTAPAYVEMACGHRSVVWLQRFSIEHDWMGRGNRVDLISPDGRVVPGLGLPPGFRLLRFAGDTLLGILRDEFDVEQAAFIRVERTILDSGSPPHPPPRSNRY